MRKFRSSLFFLVACGIFAIHEAYSIRGLENGIVWHLTQYISILLYLIAGMYFGIWFKEDGIIDSWEQNNKGIPILGYKFNHHDFREIVAVALVGILIYVFGLHWLEMAI